MKWIGRPSHTPYIEGMGKVILAFVLLVAFLLSGGGPLLFLLIKIFAYGFILMVLIFLIVAACK